jgi:hypothetical protein
VLDNRFTLLRNISLPDGVVIPLLLVGPQGVSLLNPNPIRGVFRAQENAWLAASGGSFKPDSPNLIQRTILYTRAVTAGLKKLGFSYVEVEGVLVFTNPGCHVDSIRSAMRVLLVDAITSFGTRYAQERPVLGAEDIHKIISALSHTTGPTVQTGDFRNDAFEFQELGTKKGPKTSPPSTLDQALVPIKKTLNFSTGQWILLGVMAAAMIVVLIAFLLIILFLA